MSRKQNPTIIVAIILSLIFVGALAFAALYYSGIVQFSFIGNGVTVSSISPSKVISNDADIASTNFIVSTILTGAGQSVVGSYTPDSFVATEKSTSTNGLSYQPSYNFEFGANNIQQTASYSILASYQQYYEYSIQKIPCVKDILGFACSKPAPACPIGGNSQEIGTFATVSTQTRWCLVETPKGGFGSIQPPSLKWSADLFMTSGNPTKSLLQHLDIVAPNIQSVSNSKSNVDFYDGSTYRGSAQWVGNLVTGNNPPNQANYAAVFFQDSSTWSVIPLTTYTGYNSARTALLTTIASVKQSGWNFLGISTTSESAIDQKLTNTLQYINSYETNIDGAKYSSQGLATPTGSTLGNGVINIQLSQPVINPYVVWLVRADWLGVKIPVAKPTITSVSCPTFVSGNVGAATVSVRNDGSVDGSFYASVSGCDPIKMTDATTGNIPFAVGQTKTISIRLDSGSSAPTSDLIKQCTITVTDANKASNTASQAVSCTVSPPQVCVASCTSSSQCASGDVCQDGTCTHNSNNCIVKCTSDGRGYQNVQCCTQAVLIDGKWQCKTAQCSKDTDCNAGYVCSSSVCVLAPSPPCTGSTCPSQCNTNADCPQGYACLGNVCKLKQSNACVFGFSQLNPFTWLGCEIDKFLFPAKIGGIALILLLVPFITLYAFKQFNVAGKKSGLIGYVVGLAVAAILSVLLWFYLLAGIIIFFIYSIIVGLIARLVK